MTSIPDLELIRQLEERLFDPAVRRTPQMVGMLLADDFFEFGRSGGVSTKHEVVRHLATEAVGDRGQVTAQDYRLTVLSDEAVLLTYRTIRVDRAEVLHSRRSSIWKWIDGRWQMVFHQGTPSAPDR
ncbi:nuclear transport factor 2 family protein [Ancylobacter sp. Lp-2]|uniref:nuclear transport factor 2 family protein n=1 Tax=Ancylobacter sp. Lp-2 TaxID=2881339 RepID=UPI001E3C546D|nr:nuclear transport factor 2 family protein [Ancylobacter sp. Lp-2]MCB4767647.1 nuclear transport factor 2 family protein [Ancylobacter sp. Lp-2]